MTQPSRPQLVRAVGLFSLTAIAVNGMVGSGIFVLPAQVAKLLGPAGISAYLVAGLAAGQPESDSGGRPSGRDKQEGGRIRRSQYRYAELM